MPAVGMLLKRGAGLLWNAVKNKAKDAAISGAQKAGDGITSIWNSFQPKRQTQEQQQPSFSFSSSIPLAGLFVGKDTQHLKLLLGIVLFMIVFFFYSLFQITLSGNTLFDYAP